MNSLILASGAFRGINLFIGPRLIFVDRGSRIAYQKLRSAVYDMSYANYVEMARIVSPRLIRLGRKLVISGDDGN